MEKETERQLKAALIRAVSEGGDLGGLLVFVYRTVVDWALLQTRGNQTAAAELLKINRGTLNKYARHIATPKGARRYKGKECQDQPKT